MAYEYALVHAKFTIPVAVVLTLVSLPFFNRLWWYKISTLLVIAVVATIPWDAYLIHLGIWSYPRDVIIGPCFLGIPIEELFFFVVQTYITSLIYLLFNVPRLHVIYLEWLLDDHLSAIHWGGMLAMCVVGTAFGIQNVMDGGEGLYLGLILTWATPFLVITWYFGGDFILMLPWTSVWLPILLPTVYLWFIDEMALGRGTWSITSGTKMGMRLFGNLDIEEAVFFLTTNVLVVFGLAAYDKALAIMDAHPDRFQHPFAERPSIKTLIRAIWCTRYNMERIYAIRIAVYVLRIHSRSFLTASAAFHSRLRIDLVLLYYFCRTLDNCVDGSVPQERLGEFLDGVRRFIEAVTPDPNQNDDDDDGDDDDNAAEAHELPESPRDAIRYIPQDLISDFMRSAYIYLPASHLCRRNLVGLLDGFIMDAGLASRWPPVELGDLMLYSTYVAGQVGEMCVSLMMADYADINRRSSSPQLGQERRRGIVPRAYHRVTSAACTMGMALQFINIARDIRVDAGLGRCYIPKTWLKEERLFRLEVIDTPYGPRIENIRRKLLREAYQMYAIARPAMKGIPGLYYGAMAAAVESYMEIGRVLQEMDAVYGHADVRVGKATVPFFRRLRVAVMALVSSKPVDGDGDGDGDDGNYQQQQVEE